MKKYKIFLFVIVAFVAFSFTQLGHKPVLYIIGDSTVKNGDGKNKNLLQGWGSFIDGYFDTTKITIENDAIGGRSSRTFITEGRWDKIMENLQKGDFVIMQFGHNDSGPLDDTARARGTIKGIGEDTVATYNPIRKMNETVHTYGWYMSKYLSDVKLKGAVPIVCSPIPRNDWKDGKVARANETYTLWAKQIATREDAFFIDLHNMVADVYDTEYGKGKVATFFPNEHTHTNREGAIINAEKVVEGIKSLKHCKLKNCLKK